MRAVISARRLSQPLRLASRGLARRANRVALVFAMSTGLATGLLTWVALLPDRSAPPLTTMLVVDALLIVGSALVTRWLVARELEAALRSVFEVGRSATGHERSLQSEAREWERRYIRARDLLDLIEETNKALGLHAVLDRVAVGLSRFFAGDAVAIWVYQPDGSLSRAVQVAADFPETLASAAPWVQEVLSGALRSIPATTMLQPFASSIAAPLLDPRGVVGVVAMTSLKRPGYTPEEAAFFRSVLGHASLGIQNGIAYDHRDAMARLDGLTGLQNRREFDRVFALEAERAQRYRVPLSLLVIDIDHFKQVNDQRGHPAGDSALRQVARLVQNTRLRANDGAFRLGGEEFAILLPQTESPGAVAVAERLRQGLAAQTFFPDGAGLTISIGVATFPGDVSEPAALLARADQALYEAKHAGRNRVVAAASS